MILVDVIEQFKLVVGKVFNLGKILKFDFGDEGIVFLDLFKDDVEVFNEDKEVDCIIFISIEILVGICSGDVNLMMVMMSGKVKIKGDMGLVM